MGRPNYNAKTPRRRDHLLPQFQLILDTSWWIDEATMHLNFYLLCLLPFCIMGFNFHQASTSRSMKMRDVTNVMKPSTRIQQTSLINEDGEAPSLSKLFNSPILSIGAGAGGMILLLINRLGLDVMMVSDVQSRADIIAVIGCSALLLNVLSEQDISARNRDPVPLVGYALKVPLIAEGMLPSVSSAISWCINTVLQTTPVTSVHIIEGSKVLGRGGVIGSGDDRTSILQNIEKMPILGKTLQLGEEVYLPDLQILPGKVEFSYMPINCQSVLILPLPNGGAVAMGTNQAKVLRVKDLDRIRSVIAIFRSLMATTST